MKVRDFPLLARLVIDALMLRSTVPTAIFYGVVWAFVLGHDAWVCGYLDRFGLEAPSTKLQREIAWHLGTDIAYLSMRLAFIENQVEREDVINHIGKLQAEYVAISGRPYDLSTTCQQPSAKRKE